METKKIFADGLIIKARRDTAPEWIKAHISIKVQEFAAFMKQHNNDNWINLDICASKEGKLYCQLNTWKPESKPEITKDSIPF